MLGSYFPSSATLLPLSFFDLCTGLSDFVKSLHPFSHLLSASASSERSIEESVEKCWGACVSKNQLREVISKALGAGNLRQGMRATAQ